MMSEPSRNPAMSGGARSRMQFEKGRPSDIGGLRDEGQVTLRDDVGERVVVDVSVEGFEGDVRAQAVRQRVQERAVGDRVPEVAALGIGERAPARGGDAPHRADGLVEALGYERAQLRLLVAGQA